MTGKSDLFEYLQVFEKMVKRKELLEEDWALMLVPLLNDKFRGVVTKLPPETQDNYPRLREALLERDDLHTKNAASTFWTMPKRKGVTAGEYHQTLLRLLDRFTEGEDRDSILDSIVKERLIQELPKEGRMYIRQRKPKTGLEATVLAEEFFHHKEDSYSSWSSEQADTRTQGQQSRDRQPYRRWRKDYSP